MIELPLEIIAGLSPYLPGLTLGKYLLAISQYCELVNNRDKQRYLDYYNTRHSSDFIKACVYGKYGDRESFLKLYTEDREGIHARFLLCAAGAGMWTTFREHVVSIDSEDAFRSLLFFSESGDDTGIEIRLEVLKLVKDLNISVELFREFLDPETLLNAKNTLSSEQRRDLELAISGTSFGLLE